MELTVSYLGNAQFEAEARGHRLICDQPFENQGDNEGMTPPELLLASLAACAGFYAAQYLKTRGLPSEGLKVKVRAEKAPNPARLSKFIIVMETPGVSEERHLEGVRKSAEKCLVKNTLLVAPEIEVQVTAPAAIESGSGLRWEGGWREVIGS
jgi:putative redox protein